MARFSPSPTPLGRGESGPGRSDITIDKLHFIDVARVIAVPLASRRYLPAGEPGKTKLLIMVYWGTTAVPGPTSDSTAYSRFGAAQENLRNVMSAAAHPGGNKGDAAVINAMLDAAYSRMSAATVMLNVQNHQNDRTDFANALMLGYDTPGLIGTEKGNYVRGTAFSMDRDDLYNEIEENRYFVVLMAYDFQLLWRQKTHKLLWETRFSISERRNQFDKALPLMAQYAARYFGEPSNGLMRERVPEGNVDLGDLKSLGEVDAPKK